MSTVVFRDSAGVVCAGTLIDGKPVCITYEREWPSHEDFEAGRVGQLHGGTAAANLRTVSKGSSRGAGPQKKIGRVYGRGGPADDIKLCLHGNRAVWCPRCGWHCRCPGSPKHECDAKEAA